LSIRKVFRCFFLIIICSAFAFFLARKIDLRISDLGRHLKNGEIFFKNFYAPSINLYSYTYPDFHFINHHWGSGIVFFLIKNSFGFEGLSVFFVALNLITFLIFFSLAWKYSSFEITALASVLAIPSLICRPEIRPEVFSYLFSAIFFWVLWDCKNGRLKWRWLFLLPLLELFWVNLHVYFFIGLLLIGIFLLEYLFAFYICKEHERGAALKKLVVVFGLSVLAALLNPSGLSGALYPFTIFQNYGLNLFENQSFAAIVKSTRSGAIDFYPLFYFELAFGLLVLSWFFVFIKAARKQINFTFILFALTLTFSLMAFLALRNYAIFAYFAFVITAINLGCVIKNEFRSLPEFIILSVLLILICLNIFLAKPSYWIRVANAGIGLKDGSTRAIDFFQKEHIRGPILNNYDIGGYLIYYLYPAHRVFVDNRPEAYPADFFKSTYIALQQDEETWRKMDSLYGFNAIVFNPHVSTPWGQGFLMRRVFDPLWAAVYVDDSCIIFVKKNGPNHEIAQKYALPAKMFLP
jgi:hypothetical protein